MPIYTYRCSRGHEFDAIVKMDGSDAPRSCTQALRLVLEESFGKKRWRCTCCGGFTREDSPNWPMVGHSEDCTGICALPVEKVVALNAKSFPGADSWRK